MSLGFKQPCPLNSGACRSPFVCEPDRDGATRCDAPKWHPEEDPLSMQTFACQRGADGGVIPGYYCKPENLPGHPKGAWQCLIPEGSVGSWKCPSGTILIKAE
jgi:hypothetical protein